MNPATISHVTKEEVQKQKSAKTYQISEEDYSILLQAKKRNTQMAKDQLKYQRTNSMNISKLKIKQMEREMQYKKEEVIHEVLERNKNFLDDKKPKWLIQNEIDHIEHILDLEKDNLKRMQEEHIKDVGKS